jgi:predicted nucleic acid-binding protein
MNVVVDANVVVKWYVEEPGSDEARTVAELDGLLVAPGHALAEIGEVLLRYFRRGELGPDQLEIIKTALPGTLVLVPLDELFEPALEIGAALRVSFYDALYVAAAERWDTVLITADRPLVGAAGASPRWRDRVVALDDWSHGARH